MPPLIPSRCADGGSGRWLALPVVHSAVEVLGQMPNHVIDVLVRSHDCSLEVQHFLEYIAAYEVATAPLMVPIKTAERIEVLRVSELILVEVQESKLVLETTRGRLLISERLYRFQERLNNSDFVQVSKQSLININHLEYLEEGFSGTMTAFLTGATKTSVSRKYLKDLAERLGL